VSEVTIVPGAHVPDALLDRDSDDALGLDLWLDEGGSDWIETMLGARTVTARFAHHGQCAFLPFFERRLLPGVRIGSGYPYTRIFGERRVFLEGLDALAEALAARGISRLELTFSGPDVEAARALVGVGDERIGELAGPACSRQVVDLSSLADATDAAAGFTGKLRWGIRKAGKEGVTCRQVERADCETAQHLYETVMSEKGAPAYYGVERLTFIAEVLAPRGEGAVYLADHDGEPVGMAAVVYARGSAHLKQIAVPRAHSKLRVGDLLIATVQTDAARAGRRALDFMATPDFEPGVKDFKAKWGGRSEPVVTIAFEVRAMRARAVDTLRRASRLVAAGRSRVGR